MKRLWNVHFFDIRQRSEPNESLGTQGSALADPRRSFPPRISPGSEKGMVHANLDVSCQKRGTKLVCKVFADGQHLQISFCFAVFLL